MKELAISLAYKYVAVTLMLAEANYCTERLHLQTTLPITENQIQESYVAPPLLLRSLGAIDTESYSFGFSEAGRLRYITKLQPFGNDSLRQIQQHLAKIEPKMGTNTAYQLATNWLDAIGVNVASLDHKYRSKVQQHFYHGDGGQRVLLPIFDIIWGTIETPAVIITVYGPKAQLLQLRQNDETFSRRPPRALKNLDALLAIPDEEFLTYSKRQREQLLFDFAYVIPKSPVAVNRTSTNDLMLPAWRFEHAPSFKSTGN